MRVIRVFVASAVGLAAMVCVARPAAAIRLTCEEIADLQRAGRSTDEIVKTYATTHAHIAGCERITEQKQRFAAEKQSFHLRRAERGLPD
jgi:hypothetical protein